MSDAVSADLFQLLWAIVVAQALVKYISPENRAKSRVTAYSEVIPRLRAHGFSLQVCDAVQKSRYGKPALSNGGLRSSALLPGPQVPDVEGL
ncbi:MAG: hypothetical protein ABSH28_01605 [Acidobacteriota bacterium]|jgi:hypothetical protein